MNMGNSTLIAVASFADKNTSVTLNVDWTKLGLDPHDATRPLYMHAPKLLPMQPDARTFDPLTAKLECAKGQGWLLVLTYAEGFYI